MRQNYMCNEVILYRDLKNLQCSINYPPVTKTRRHKYFRNLFKTNNIYIYRYLLGT